MARWRAALQGLLRNGDVPARLAVLLTLPFFDGSVDFGLEFSQRNSIGELLEDVAVIELCSEHGLSGTRHHDWAKLATAHDFALEQVRHVADRKSTRLNSSHANISYAV